MLSKDVQMDELYMYYGALTSTQINNLHDSYRLSVVDHSITKEDSVSIEKFFEYMFNLLYINSTLVGLP